jgi:O-antigen/teichoic acid export membrane protein
MSTGPQVEGPVPAPEAAGVVWSRHRLARIVRQPLFANAGYLWGVTVVGGLVGFLCWGIAARLYTPEQLGIASAVVSVVGLLSRIAGMGVGEGLVRFLPEARRPRRLLNTALTFTGLAALLVGGVYLAGIGLWSPSLEGLRANALYVAAFLAFNLAVTLFGILQMTFVARRRAGYALVQTGIASGLRLLLVVPLVGLGAAGLTGSVAIGFVVAAALSLTVSLPRVEVGYRPRPDWLWADLAPILPYSAGTYLAQLLVQAPQLLLPLLVLETLGPAASGYAYIAWMLGTALASPGVALAHSAFAEGSNAPDSLRAVLSRSMRAGLVLTGAGALAIVVAAPWVLRIFGTDYAAEAVTLLRLLAAAVPLVVLSLLYFTRLQVEKRIGRLILLSGVIAVLTLGLAALLMPRYGITASGVGWLLGNGLVAGLALVAMWRDRG